MPDQLSHLGWPYLLGVSVEQDSDDELLAAAAVITCTPRGHRDDLPDFGVTQPVFVQGPIDLELLASELVASDPRLTADLDEEIDLTQATVRTVHLAIQQSSE